MSTDYNKIIVKVANKSKVRFSNSKVYRAIAYDDLVRTASNNDDCHIVVIEKIFEDEQDDIKNFCIDFKNKNDKNIVIFYIPDDDDITSGIADELDYNIYLTLESIYNTIYELFNINVSISIDDKKRLNAEADENVINATDDIFGKLSDNSEEDIQTSISHIEAMPEISDITEVSISDDISTVDDSVQENTEIENAEIENDITIESEDSEQELYSDVAENNNTTVQNDDNTENSIVEELKLQLRDAKYDYNELLKDMKAANNRIKSLEDIVNTLRDEKDAVCARYDELVVSEDVLEDPISLAEYTELKQTIDSLNNLVKELNSTINDDKETITNNEALINEKDEKIAEYREKRNAVRDELDAIKASIESGEIHKDVVAEYEDKIKDLEHANETLNTNIDNLSSQIDTLKQSITDMSIKLQSESETRTTTYNKLKQAFDKIRELNECIVNYKKEIQQLSNSKQQIENENESYISEIAELKSKVDMLNSSVSAAEQSIKSSGINNQSLANTNRTLEQSNKSLIEQSKNNATEIDRLKRTNTELEAQVRSNNMQIQQLNGMIEQLSSGENVGVTNNIRIKPFNYSGKAQILQVIGSGSFGITTTAMSLAYKLYTTSKVLYIDFDLITPKADAWFSKMPLCTRVPNIDKNDRRMTGLGIFYEYGIQEFEKNYEHIVNRCDTTKNGGIDYLSGAYYRVDTIKLLTANYSELFEFLSNKYQYIIIDCGKLGCNEVNDQIIKNISDIAISTITVTNHDRFEVRNFKAKLTETNININNIAWLLNMCESTNIDDKIREIIKPSRLGIMIYDGSLRGHREKFTRIKMTKDKFELFVNSVVFA